MAIVLRHGIIESPVKLLSCQAMYIIEGAVGTSAGIHIDHAQFGTRVCTTTPDGGVV
ncbi:hypothetical protein D3C80_2213590 [compost metagenome]